MFAAFLSCVAVVAAHGVAAASTNAYGLRALQLADRIATCSFSPLTGFFVGEEEWQSGNTLESLSRATSLVKASPDPSFGPLVERISSLLVESFAATPVIVDNCFDDHQWRVRGGRGSIAAALLG